MVHGAVIAECRPGGKVQAGPCHWEMEAPLWGHGPPQKALCHSVPPSLGRTECARARWGLASCWDPQLVLQVAFYCTQEGNL